MIDIAQALKSLHPDCEFVTVGNEITWLSTGIAQPSDAEIQTEIARLQAEESANAYKAKRASEYPPITDYIDGVVKGDQAQIDKYIADCLAVKAKYPKGVS